MTINTNKSLNLLFISSPVGSLGSGMGGGVELTVKNIAEEMLRRGHSLKIVAPQGSVLGTLPIIAIAGELQTSAQTQPRNDLITMPGNAVLANMWNYARQVQADYDLIVNFAYDWLPFYLTSFFTCPIAHLISMGSLTDAMDQIIEQVANQFPKNIAFHSRVQAATFSFGNQHRCLGNGFDLSLYNFCAKPDNCLAWVGRIAPEKGLEDAVSVAEMTGIPLKILGKIQDEEYWQQVCQKYPHAPVEYLGFLPTEELQKELGKCKAMLVTPRWVEAFGNVVIEALACGVPVIAYRRGGPSEIVEDGKTGFLVEPDSVMGLIEAIKKIEQIDRDACRQEAEREYSMSAMGDRIEQWFWDILS
ncbi:MAG TPA: glycosyltransferase family 4 protein [Oculatellaceae cyanobacterium]